MNKFLEIKHINYPINFRSIAHLIKLIFKNKSPIRIFHNFFLKDIEIKGKTIDLGSGNHSSYLNYLIKLINHLEGINEPTPSLNGNVAVEIILVHINQFRFI